MKTKACTQLVAAFTGILLLGGTAVFADLNTGLVAYYPFDGNANDASAYAVHGTLYGGVSFVSGHKGQAAQFDGSSGYIWIPADASRSFYANCFSVAFWFRTSEQDYGYMLDSRTSMPRERGYGLILHTSGPGLVWGPANDAQQYPPVQVSARGNMYQDGNWHLAVGVREADAIALYVDGLLVERANILASLDVGPAYPVYLGKRFELAEPSSFYAGDMDDLRIWNRALSEAEIQELAGGDVDADGDGVPDASDQCPNTPPGEVVNAAGCSISQLVPASWPWKNHGEYVSAVAEVAGEFMAQGLITGAQKGATVSAAARSDIGKKR